MQTAFVFVLGLLLHSELLQKLEQSLLLSWELTFEVFYVEVFKLPLDLTEQVQQIAPQRQRQLGVLERVGKRRALKKRGNMRDYPKKLFWSLGHLTDVPLPTYFEGLTKLYLT